MVALVPCGKGVHRDGCYFEAQEEREQIAGRNDGESAEGGECHGADKFCNLVHSGLAVSAVLKVVLRKPDAENGRNHQYFAHQNAEIVDVPVSDEEPAHSARKRNEVQQDEDGDEPDVRNAPGHLGAVGTEKSTSDHDERKKQKQ